MKPFPGINDFINVISRDPNNPIIKTATESIEAGDIMISSLSGRGAFFRFLSERWKRRHEEGFDFSGAISHLDHILTGGEILVWRELGFIRDEDAAKAFKRDVAELLAGFRREKERDVHRDRKINARHSAAAHQESNLTSVIEILIESMTRFRRLRADEWRA